MIPNTQQERDGENADYSFSCTKLDEFPKPNLNMGLSLGPYDHEPGPPQPFIAPKQSQSVSQFDTLQTSNPQGS